MTTPYVFLVVLTFTVVYSRHVEQRQIGPHCDVICDDETGITSSSVCGTDGKLYKNKCEYNNALCKARISGTNLLYVSIGPECVTDITTCDVLAKTQCVRLPHSLPSIPSEMPTVSHSLVCGSDGKTYGSLCELMQTRCKLQTDTLVVDHDGQCDLALGNNSRMVDCSRYVMDLAGLALEGGSHVTLRARPCEKIYKPVCGLDNHTYGNECTFCGHLAYTHQIQTGHLSVYIKNDGRCTEFNKG